MASRHHECDGTNTGNRGFEDIESTCQTGSAPRLCITNQISPSHSSPSTRRKRLARKHDPPLRYAPRLASSIAEALLRKAERKATSLAAGG